LREQRWTQTAEDSANAAIAAAAVTFFAMILISSWLPVQAWLSGNGWVEARDSAGALIEKAVLTAAITPTK